MNGYEFPLEQRPWFSWVRQEAGQLGLANRCTLFQALMVANTMQNHPNACWGGSSGGGVRPPSLCYTGRSTITAPPGSNLLLELNPIPAKSCREEKPLSLYPPPFVLQRNRIQIPPVSTSNPSSREALVASCLWPLPSGPLPEPTGHPTATPSLPGAPRTWDTFPSNETPARVAKSRSLKASCLTTWGLSLTFSSSVNWVP